MIDNVLDNENVQIDFKALYQCIHIYDTLDARDELQSSYQADRRVRYTPRVSLQQADKLSHRLKRTSSSPPPPRSRPSPSPHSPLSSKRSSASSSSNRMSFARQTLSDRNRTSRISGMECANALCGLSMRD